MASQRLHEWSAHLRRLFFEGRYSFLVQCALGVLMTLALTALGVVLHLNLSTASLLYLLLVVSFAVRSGFWQASVVSVFAFLCDSYFFTTPLHSFFVGDPQNVISLVVFEVTAIVVSRISAREKEQAEHSERDRRRTQRLYSVSHDVLLLNPQDAPERQIAEFIVKEFELEAVAIVNELLGSVRAAGEWADKEDWLARQMQGSPSRLKGNVSQRSLYSANGKVGSLLVLGDISALALDSLASLVVLALERHRAFVNQGAAEAARKTEQLRTTVLDGLAHAIKTPLTIIRAASSGLLEVGQMDETQGQLAQMIDEQSIRIEELTSRLLQTARVAEDHLSLQLETVDVPELIHEVVRDFQGEYPDQPEVAAENPTIHISISHCISPIAADHEMLSTTLKELLTNALKYSHPGSPITIRATDSDAELCLSVHSYGQVIRDEDRDHIFKKFYRSSDHRHAAPGTGLGLSVALRVTEAHGGHIWFNSSDLEGTTFYLSLPRTHAAV